MSYFTIGNVNNPPLNNVNGDYVNKDGSNIGNIAFSNTIPPTGQHTLPPAGNNIQGASGIYPCAQKGGKINRNKINKISRKYKMKGSRKTMKRRMRKIKNKLRSKYSRRHSRRRSSKRLMRGGAFQPPMSTPNYPAGHSQYLNNNGSISNTYSLGGQLSASNSALANPPPFKLDQSASVPDNLNHNTLNSYGNIGSGSGFPSRGSF